LKLDSPNLSAGSGADSQRSFPETCLFCRIILGKAEAYRVFEDSVCLAFLDHRPLFPGHSLLLPKQHYETLADLPGNLLGPLFSGAQLLSRAMELGLEAEGSFVAINNRVSQSVPHLHIHIVPRRRKDGLKGFFWPRQAYKDREERLHVQQAIQAAVARLRA
jgi:histidine triad (HIT) family protein